MKVWNSLDSVEQEELLVEDLVWALTSEVWNGMDRVLGLRLSNKFQSRFRDELLVSLEIRREEEREKQKEELRKEQERLRKTPEYQFEKALERKYRGVELGICFEMNDALSHIIWYTCPDLRKEFKPDTRFEDEFRCLEPNTFLDQSDVELIFPVWKRIFEADYVFDAIKALRAQSDSDGGHQTQEPELVASGVIDEDAALDWLLAEIGDE